MSHLWSGRFSTPPDAGVFEFGRSFPFDRRLFEDDVVGSAAWAEALRGAGAITAEDSARLADALAEILERASRDPGFVDGPDEDVHAFVERVLVERVGEAGKRLHTGRSRNDQVSLDLRLYLRRRIPVLQAGIATLAAALARQARGAGGSVMASYTHLRPAQPVLVAHYLLAHVQALRRDHAQLEAARQAADAMPLGSGAIAGTAYAVDVHALASRLGFSRVAANSIDATSDRDFVASFLFAAALAMVHLSRLGEDLILLSSEEFGVFELSDAVATGSSLMPQKKNPDPLELIRGKAGRAIGGLTGWLVTMKGLPAGYNKDLQEDKEAVFDAEDTLAGSLAAAATVVSGLALDAVRAREMASGLLLATDVADYLVARGLPFRDAHRLVAGLVQRLARQGRTFESLTPAEWRAVSPLFAEDVRRAITPEAAIAARLTPQSTNPEAVAAALDEAERWLSAHGASTSTP